MSQPPNLVLIHSDQHRWDCVGAHGQRRISTPALDRLAREGTRFDHAFTPCPVCSPARASLLTGAWPTTHGCLSIPRTEPFRPARPDLPTVCGLLRDAGYFQGWVGKFHQEVEGRPQDHGVDAFVPHEDYPAWRAARGIPPLPAWQASLFGAVDADCPAECSALAWQGDQCVRLLEAACQRPDRPFFLRWDPPEPHLPCLPTSRFAEMYPPEAVEPWTSFPDPLEGKPRAQHRQRRIWGIEGWTWREWAPVAARYHAVVTELDAQIARLLAWLDQHGLAENTLVIYSSDHGDFCGGHGLIDKHFSMYDDITRVPLIARWPGRLEAGAVARGFAIAQLDLARTLLEAAGVPPPPSFVGRNLLHLAGGSADRQVAFSQYFGTESGCYSSRMVRTARFKYVFNPTAFDELYDLDSDPGEILNRIDDPKMDGILHRLRAAMAAEMAAIGDPLLNLWTRVHLLGEPSISARADPASGLGPVGAGCRSRS